MVDNAQDLGLVNFLHIQGIHGVSESESEALLSSWLEAYLEETLMHPVWGCVHPED